MLRKTLLMGLLLALGPSLAFAQDHVRIQGDRACGRDATRLCKRVLDQGDFAILACFQQNQTKLTASCRKFLRDQGQLQ